MKADELVKIRRDLHQIPELGFQEKKTQAYLLEFISSLPAHWLELKIWKTGIIVKLTGSEGTRTIGYRADMDGLPLEERTSYEGFRSQHPGHMHACGHDFHMTIALGILAHYAGHQPKENLLFLFQPAEEGPGGAKPMLEAGILKDWWPDEIIALHIAPEYPVGTIATKAGLLFANTSELFIDLKGKGGHAAYPHQANDMVVAASYFVTQLQTIVSRNINPLDSAVVTIGVIQGGTKQNVIAESARIEGTIRSLSINSMQGMKQRIEALAKGMETGFACEISIDYGANYCEVNNNPELVDEFMRFSSERSGTTLIESPTAMTGEDFGYFLKEIPGFMFWLGVNSPFSLHDPRLEPDEEALSFAVNHLLDYLQTRMQN